MTQTQFNHSLKINNQNGWFNWLNEQEFKLFLTITTSQTYADNAVIKYLNQALHFVNSKVFGRKYKKYGKYIEGFCMFERHGKRKHTIELVRPKYISRSMIKNPLHMHLLINDSEILKKQLEDKSIDFEALVRKQFGRVITNTKYCNAVDRDKYRVFNNSGIDIQKVYDKKHVIEYVTKTKQYNEAMGVLGMDGVIVTADNIW